ncbi:patatin-like phospholipase family protein [Paludisphaera rhizosphaerae]|uniref:patatin-like phospholipase family protein n=1 Tax=Paludisphaera rhizosphaerae TaxID=2711216 RepID=UPI0013EB5F19|nr:patatin-like phospholipase family protein [Paludisphaera rhizosphaerae]
MALPNPATGGWSPVRVRDEFGLKLSSTERETIRAKFPKSSSPEPGVFLADGVFEGGGVLGLAFLGAARCCADIGIRWMGLAGTSAGAITASLMAAIPDIDELERLFGSVDFKDFIGEKSSPFIVDFDPTKDLDHPAHMLVKLLVAGRLGQYSSAPFLNWIQNSLKDAGVSTFADVSVGNSERQLKVVVSNLTRGQMLVLPDDLPEKERDSFPVAEAVRLSMSIPLFFEPGQLNGDCIVDGGILSNYPVWIFDEEDPLKEPRWPTFGFRLFNSREEKPLRINTAPDILKGMFKTMMCAHDRHNLSRAKRTRTINVDVTMAGVSTTQFGLSDEHKDVLYRHGYESTKRYLLEEWSWEVQLESRGFANAS